MPFIDHSFLFDVNFSFGDESVFTQIDADESAPFPPVVGYFLYLDGTVFTLLDGQNLALL